jgi:hypothetical protein
VILQTVVSLMSVIDDTSKAMTKANKQLIVQALVIIITYNRQNIFIVQATECTETLFRIECCSYFNKFC